MAEQEAVANVVANAVSDTTQGESLLLPLLQELLDKKCSSNVSGAPVMQRSASSQSSEESGAATIDSGTESGEELRFLAAGLAEGCEPLGPGLLAEVQNALNKLSLSLQMDDSPIETDRKNSLLQLVARLQASLVVPTSRPPSERRSSSGGRFSRNKNRQNRHTVGVSSEELEAARKLMQEVVLRDTLTGATDYVQDYNIQKQNSDGTINQYKPQVKNATPKPYTAIDLKSISEPSTPNLNYKPPTNTFRQTSLNLEPEMSQPNYSQSISAFSQTASLPQMEWKSNNNPPSDLWQNNPVESWKTNSDPWEKGNTSEFNVPDKMADYNIPDFDGVETDDDSSTIKQLDYNTSTPVSYVTDVKTISRSITPTNDYGSSQLTNEYPDYRDNYPNKDMSAAQRLLNIAINDESKTQNRFNNKKLKMKRANTIDIPKPLNYYECEDDTDEDILDRDEPSTRRSNYLALRGPIRVGPSKSTVPSFEPKTENDKKFVAFIQKHNNSQSVSSIWANKEPVKKSEHNWSNKFGNIKTIFEKEESGGSRPPSTNINSAKQFWQSADDAVNAGKKSYNGPTVSKKGTRQLQSLFEQKQQESKLPWTTTEHNNVVTGTLKVESNFKPIQNNQLVQGKHYKFVPQPLPVNKFDHAPMSAFKPPPKRTSHSFTSPKPKETSEHTTPLFLYTPKIPEFPAQEEPKPSSTPWINPENKSEHRVLSIAAKKFENSPREMSPQPQPTRKPSKDKISIPPGIQNTENKELSAPYLVKNAPSKQMVRKLSGEYDHNRNNNKIENIVTYKKPVERQIQTVRQNVEKFSGYEKPEYTKPKGTKEDFEVSGVNKAKSKYRPVEEYEYKPNYPKRYQYEPEKQYSYNKEEQKQDKQKGKYQQEERQKNVYDYDNRHIHDYQYEKTKRKEYQIPEKESYQSNQYPQEDGKYQYQNNEKENNSQYSRENQKQNYQYLDDNQFKSDQQQGYQYKDSHYQDNQKQLYQYDQNNKKSQYPYLDDDQEYQYKHERKPEYQKETYQYPPEPEKQNYSHPQGSDKLVYQYSPDKKESFSYPEQYYDSQVQSHSQQYYHPDSHKPTKPNPFFDFPSSESTSRSASTVATPENLDEPEPVVTSPLTEYKAVSKVMTGPVSQQAVTVSQNTPKKREEHDFAARNLTGLLKISMEDDKREKSPISTKSELKENQNLNNNSKSKEVHQKETKDSVDYGKKSKETVPSNYNKLKYSDNYQSVAKESSNAYSQPQTSNRPYTQATPNKVQPKLSTERLEINDDGESVVVTKLQIPVSRNVYYNNVDPNRVQKRVTLEEVEAKNRRLSPLPPSKSPLSHSYQSSNNQLSPPQPILSKSPQTLSKSDSWHKFAENSAANRPSPRASPKARVLQKAKSSHSLAVPKQFEAGISRDEVEVKKKTVAAYFGPASTKEVITRKKTSEKISTQTKVSGLSRSRTMPDVADLFEDPSDIDTEFENIFRATIAK